MEKSETICIFDIVKFILSFLIVAIHTCYNDFIYPWVLIAVPIFFMTSSYLFFSKQKSKEKYDDKKLALNKFVIRNISLYIFWFLATFPFMACTRSTWFTSGIITSVFKCIRGVLFGSTFLASWFISALIIATAIIFFASKKFSNTVLLVLSLIIYLLIAITTTYKSVLISNASLLKVIAVYDLAFSRADLSFPFALFWCVIGKIFAETENRLKTLTVVAGAIVGYACCYAEWKFVYSKTGNYGNATLILLVIICPLIFDLLRRININIKHSKTLRSISVIVFASQGAAISISQLFQEKLMFQNTLIHYITTVSICLLISFIILKLEKKPMLRFFSYSH